MALSTLSSQAAAQERDRDRPRRELPLPIELDFDYGVENGTAIISRYLTLVAFSLGEKT